MHLFFTRLKRFFSCSRLCPYIWQNQKRIAEQAEPLGWKSRLLNNDDTLPLSLYWLSRPVWFTRVGFSCLTDEIHANQAEFLKKNRHLKLNTTIQYFGWGKNLKKLVLATSRKWNARTAESKAFPSAQLRTRNPQFLCQDRWQQWGSGKIGKIGKIVLVHQSPKPPCYLNDVSVPATKTAWLPR